MEYAMSVIIGRALPDVRDGLKPVHRRALYAMYDLKNFHTQSYKKSARVVGDVIGKYHPHGDQAAYDTIVRMAQPFSMRYLLVDGQGNFGSVDGDSAAAMRYTEVRLTALAGELLKDLDKETVDHAPNYDGSLHEPTVLPAPYPNLLANGSSGIAVGMATNIPPHNLAEVIDATVALINNPAMTSEELMEIVPGPDFPTAGIICGTKGIRDAYTTGRGKIRVRARAHFEGKDGDEDTIVVTELPYQVNKARLLEQIAGLVKDKRIEGIRDLRDESDRTGMRMVIECKRDAIPQIVMNKLYRMTTLQTTFGVLSLAIVQGQPKILTLYEMLAHFVDHRRDVITRRCLYELREKEKRAHILEGYVIALDNIDEVVELIKNSANPLEAREGLMTRFGLSEIQAIEILNMRLQRLTGLERNKIKEELAEVMAEIERLRAILADERLLMDLIVEELTAIRAKYADERRTEILPFDGDLTEEDLIADEDVVITITHAEYIKRTPLSEYQTQRRAGQGKLGAGTKTEDYIRDMFVASNHQNLLVFTDTGRVFPLKVYRLPQGGRYARGKPIVNLVQLIDDERVTNVLPIRDFTEGQYLLFATRMGLIKKTDVMAYSKVRSTGIRAIHFQEGDSLVTVKLLEGDNQVMLTSRQGKACRFVHTDVRAMGRVSRGVRGIRLAEGDAVVSMEVLDLEQDVLSVTENGYGKRTPIDQYRVTKRGGKGIVTILTTERNGLVMSALQVGEDDQVMMVTDGGMTIRFKVNDLRSMGRYTQGVRLVRLRDGERVVAVDRLMDVEDDESEITSIDGEVPEGDEENAAALEAAEVDADDDDDDDVGDESDADMSVDEDDADE